VLTAAARPALGLLGLPPFTIPFLFATWSFLPLRGGGGGAEGANLVVGVTASALLPGSGITWPERHYWEEQVRLGEMHPSALVHYEKVKVDEEA
jgi:hypothetical protein